MWNGDIWSLIWVLGICTLTGGTSCQLAPVPAAPSSLTPTSSTAEAFLGAISSSGGLSLLSHIFSSLPKGAPNLLHRSTSLKQLAEQIPAGPWLLPESRSHTTAWLCITVS